MMGDPPIRSEGIFCDFRANARNPRVQLMLASFRVIQAVAAAPGGRVLSRILEAPYRVIFEWFMGMELRPKTTVGPRLTIYHGTGLVVNDHAVIGSDVVLRNGVVIGHRRSGGECPIIGSGVSVGANAVILGSIEVGDGAQIGAAAVVLQSVPANAVAVGNPARILNRTGDE